MFATGKKLSGTEWRRRITFRTWKVLSEPEVSENQTLEQS